MNGVAPVQQEGGSMSKGEEIIKIAMLRVHITSIKDLADRIGLEPATLRYSLRNPGGMPLGRLRAIAEVINLSSEEIATVVQTTPMR